MTIQTPSSALASIALRVMAKVSRQRRSLGGSVSNMGLCAGCGLVPVGEEVEPVLRIAASVLLEDRDVAVYRGLERGAAAARRHGGTEVDELDPVACPALVEAEAHEDLCAGTRGQRVRADRERRRPTEKVGVQRGCVLGAVGQRDDDAAALEYFVGAQVAVDAAERNDRQLAVVDAGDSPHPGALVDVHEEGDRTIVENLVLERHEVEAAEMRAEQDAALARLERLHDERVAVDGDVETMEIAVRHPDAIEQRCGEAVQ